MDCLGIIAGDGEERSKLQQQAQARGLDEANIIFMGAVEESADLLLRTDALALCSDFEGFPNVILEAMAAGIPVIATRVGAVGELIRDGWNGILINPGSVDELKQAMKKMAASQSLRRSMGMNGRQIVIREFNAQGQSAKFLKLVGIAARQKIKKALFRLLDYRFSKRILNEIALNSLGWPNVREESRMGYNPGRDTGRFVCP
jgi:glycosyltransferase involved in cell wall biosynthesis